MSFNRALTLRHWKIAKQGAANPDLPAEKRALYRRARDLAEVALGLHAAHQRRAAAGEPEGAVEGQGEFLAER